MAALTLEKRVQQLESRLDQLQAELRAAQRPGKDWRRTIGAFTDDDGMQAILHEAMRLRELDRKTTRPKKAIKRKNSR